ncbi:PIN domain-containing protein [Dyadobacter soli]|uniref:PIN domain-containing protein n=1 Tax=Dyadobacter soli TaxID=659014 RepID=A0A1G7X9Y6_9BACT|nr:PIN domain-containing protein [Dyadobacter soli]SDG81032.1 PIN domain-containing protein [Dyadobacter soli]
MRPRYYIDTSVFGGVFDTEFATESLQIFELVKSGKIICILSEVTESELINAPERVRQFAVALNSTAIERVKLITESITLAETYISEKVVGATSRDDCLHIATATVYAADALLSWNFKHIVNEQRIKGYNCINLRLGYKELDIVSPKTILIR